MSRLRDMLRWYGTPAGWVWCAVGLGLLLGIAFERPVVIVPSVGVLVMLMLPYKDMRAFSRSATLRGLADAQSLRMDTHASQMAEIVENARGELSALVREESAANRDEVRRVDAIVQARIDTLAERGDSVEATVNSVRQELADAVARVNDAESALSALRESLAQTRSALDGRLTQLDGRLKQSEGRLDDAESTSRCDGTVDSYFLAPGYRRRLAVVEDFDDTTNEDQWQREVYDYALGVAAQADAKAICDFGCGSAFKLMERFGDFETTGIDRPEVVHWLKAKYPERNWRPSGAHLDTNLFSDFDFVIGSDVIEHLVDPAELLRALAASDVKNIILSTPAREYLSEAEGHRPLGPPRNPYHYSEWTMSEFEALISAHFQIVCHRLSNRGQATQMIHARPLGFG